MTATTTRAGDEREAIISRARSLVDRYCAEVMKPGEIDWGRHHEFASEAIGILGDLITAPPPASTSRLTDEQIAAVEKAVGFLYGLGQVKSALVLRDLLPPLASAIIAATEGK